MIRIRHLDCAICKAPGNSVASHAEVVTGMYMGIYINHMKCLPGVDKAARDMAQMQRSTQQIERALERVKVIQRGSGTLVRPSSSCPKIR